MLTSSEYGVLTPNQTLASFSMRRCLLRACRAPNCGDNSCCRGCSFFTLSVVERCRKPAAAFRRLLPSVIDPACSPSWSPNAAVQSYSRLAGTCKEQAGVEACPYETLVAVCGETLAWQALELQCRTL